MKFLTKISAEWWLRLGMGGTYLYSGIEIMRAPTSWIWAVPTWFTDMVTPIMPITTFMRVQAATEILIALCFLAWFLKPGILKWVALLGTLEMAGILFLGKTGIDAITFRDIGLLGALMALVVIFINKDSSATKK